jgi:hypothetical protein
VNTLRELRRNSDRLRPALADELQRLQGLIDRAILDADTTEYKLADILDLAHHMDGEWPAAIKRQLKGHKQHPSDKDLFATCLRACAAFRRGTRVADVFTPAKDRSGAQLVADLYPMPPVDARP